MSREGLTIESQTLWDQLETLATVLQPTYDALRRYVLTSPVVGADETWWRLLGSPEKKRWWACSKRGRTATRSRVEGYQP
jgi:transposase